MRKKALFLCGLGLGLWMWDFYVTVQTLVAIDESRSS